MAGRKFDQNKPPMDLIDDLAEEELARVLDYGARKYSPNEWRQGLNHDAVRAAIRRHQAAIGRGELRDPETGLLHAAHIMAEAMFLTNFQLAGIPSAPDTRWTKVQLEPPTTKSDCVCGHAYGDHYQLGPRPCGVLVCDGRCSCLQYIPAEKPRV